MSFPVPAHTIIPHRNAMLLIDSLTRSGQGEGVVEAHLGTTSAAVDDSGTLSPFIHVELIAQAYAAVKGWEIIQAGLEVPVGYLVGVQKFEVHETAEADDPLKIHVATIGEFEGFAVVQGTVTRNNTPVAGGKIKVWVPEEDAP